MGELRQKDIFYSIASSTQEYKHQEHPVVALTCMHSVWIYGVTYMLFYACVCIYVDQRMISGVFLDHSLPYTSNKGLLLEPRVPFWLMQLVDGQLGPQGYPVFTSYTVGLYTHHQKTVGFIKSAGKKWWVWIKKIQDGLFCLRRASPSLTGALYPGVKRNGIKFHNVTTF